jgi:hypothetical protein
MTHNVRKHRAGVGAKYDKTGCLTAVGGPYARMTHDRSTDGRRATGSWGRDENPLNLGPREFRRAGDKVLGCGSLPGPRQEPEEENWEKLKKDAGSSMLETLNCCFSRPNWNMTLATRWILVASTPIG